MKNLCKKAAANFLKGWQTTLLGLILFAATIFSVFEVESVNWSDAVLPLVFAVMLMLWPQKVGRAMGNFIDRKGPVIVLLPFLFLACTGAKDSKQSQDSETGTLKTTTNATSVLKRSIDADSAKLKVSISELDPWEKFEAQDGRATVSAWVTDDGWLMAQADCKGETLIDTIEVEVLTEATCTHPAPPAPAPEQEKPTAATWVYKNVLMPLILIILSIAILLASAYILKDVFERLFLKQKIPE